jgi:twitching motility protein PilT
MIDISHITLPDGFHLISDFYLPEEKPMFGVLYPNAMQLKNYPEYVDVIEFLMEEAKKKKKLEFSLELIHEGERIILRGHSINSVEGKVFIFRRLPSYVPDIEKIGMPKNIVELLLSDRLNSGGLVIIAGETGQGKSTTAGATIAYRLSHFGSFCLSIEDPVELPLQGFYVNDRNDNVGVCFQTNVEDSDDLIPAIKSSLRCYPSISNSILFLGEVRDSQMASEVLKISANGHLVITTMHGSDLVTALKRFIGMAISSKDLGEAEVKSLFSSVFRLMIHQKMDHLPGGKKRIRPQIIFSPDSASSVASRLRTGNIELLATEIQNQNTMIQKGSSLLT